MSTGQNPVTGSYGPSQSFPAHERADAALRDLIDQQAPGLDGVGATSSAPRPVARRVRAARPLAHNPPDGPGDCRWRDCTGGERSGSRSARAAAVACGSRTGGEGGGAEDADSEPEPGKKWNFLQPPPPDILEGFSFDMNELSPVAMEILSGTGAGEDALAAGAVEDTERASGETTLGTFMLCVRPYCTRGSTNCIRVGRGSGTSRKAEFGGGAGDVHVFMTKESDDVVELSSLSLDGKSLEDQINEALGGDA